MSRKLPTTLTTTWMTPTKTQTTRIGRPVTGRWWLGSTLWIWQMGLARRSSTRWMRTQVTRQRSSTREEAGRGRHRYQDQLLQAVVRQRPLTLCSGQQPSAAHLRQSKELLHLRLHFPIPALVQVLVVLLPLKVFSWPKVRSHRQEMKLFSSVPAVHKGAHLRSSLSPSLLLPPQEETSHFLVNLWLPLLIRILGH